MDGRMDGWMDGLTDRWTDGQTQPIIKQDASKKCTAEVVRDRSVVVGDIVIGDIVVSVVVVVVVDQARILGKFKCRDPRKLDRRENRSVECQQGKVKVRRGQEDEEER